MSEPLSGSGTAAALGGATVYGLFTGTDFGIVFGAFAGALFVATMPQALSAWRVAAHFLVSFIVGVLGARVLSAWIASKTGYDGASADALCAVLVPARQPHQPHRTMQSVWKPRTRHLSANCSPHWLTHRRKPWTR
ncbi:putative holin [Escherichia coli]